MKDQDNLPPHPDFMPEGSAELDLEALGLNPNKIYRAARRNMLIQRMQEALSQLLTLTAHCDPWGIAYLSAEAPEPTELGD